MAVQNVSSKQNIWLFQMRKDFDRVWRERVKSQFYAIGRDKEDLTGETRDWNLIQRQETEVLD